MKALREPQPWLVALAGLAVVLLLAGRASGGAWPTLYQYGETEPAGSARAYAIVSLKHELIFRGYGKNLTEAPSFGDAMRNRVREFQAAQGLSVNGVIGSVTARRLFRKRVYAAEDARGIPNHVLCRLLALESGFDPAATGFANPADRGLAQINSAFHPDVTDAEAFDGAFSIRWAASYLKAAADHFDDLTPFYWRAAIVSYNAGWGGANDWLHDGMPADDTRTRYLNLVLDRDC